MEELVAAQPDARLTFAAFLARRAKHGEALQMASAHSGRPDPASFARVVESMYQSGPIADEHRRQADELLTRALDDFLRTHPALAEQTSDQSQSESAAIVPLLLAKAALHADADQLEQLEATYRKVLEYDPANVVALNDLAMLQATRPKPRPEAINEAQRHVEQAILIAGELPALLDTRAVVAIAGRRFRAALDDLEAALSQSPAAEFYFHQAVALAELGDVRAAKSALEEAERLGLAAARLNPGERLMHERISRALY